MTFPSVKSKVHVFADDTVTYLAVKSMVDCLQLQQDLLSLETGNQIKKWISIPSNVVLVTLSVEKNSVCANADVNKPDSGILAVFTLEQ